MTQTTTDENVQNLILFIAKEKSIPATTRRDFLVHISEQGLDERTLSFMQKHLERLEKEHQKALERAQYKQEVYQQSLFNDDIPEISAEVQVINQAEQDMEAMLEDFKTNFKGHEKDVAQEEESTETQGEQTQIEALKAQL